MALYRISADLLSTFFTTQGLHITLYRFTNNEVVFGNRTLDFITYSSYSGLFKFKPSL
ncbi:MAG: hypothetical protein HQ463_01630 [Bacteroidetes bacterium]|nr:hypothetical protein [Bacteroidota bacterium]